MDVAELEVLIEKAERMGMGWFEDEEIDVFVPALIAALREQAHKTANALTLVDDLEIRMNKCADLYVASVERADRAEMEVKRLVEAHNDLFNQWEQASGECAKLHAVREAAESVRPLLTQIVQDRYPDRDLEASLGVIWDALDACHETQR